MISAYSFEEVCFLQESYGNMQNIQSLTILKVSSIRHQGVCLLMCTILKRNYLLHSMVIIRMSKVRRKEYEVNNLEKKQNIIISWYLAGPQVWCSPFTHPLICPKICFQPQNGSKLNVCGRFQEVIWRGLESHTQQNELSAQNVCLSWCTPPHKMNPRLKRSTFFHVVRHLTYYKSWQWSWIMVSCDAVWRNKDDTIDNMQPHQCRSY